MANKFTDSSPVNIEAVLTGDITVAVAVVASGRISIHTLAFVGMLALIPHIPEMLQLSTDAALTNPLHGTLLHYLISSFLCYGCENAMIPPLPGLSTAQGANGEPSQCAKVKVSSEKMLADLRKTCEDRGLKVPDYDNIFFKFHASPGSLRGDQNTSSSGFSSRTSVQAEAATEPAPEGLSESDEDA